MRLSLVALLLLSLWPSTAAASHGASAGEVPRLSAAEDRLGEGLQRAPGGLELLRLVEAPAPGGAGADQRAPGPHPVGAAAAGKVAPRHRPLRTSGAATEGSVPRCCEILPYFATAPPFRG